MSNTMAVLCFLSTFFFITGFTSPGSLTIVHDPLKTFIVHVDSPNDTSIVLSDDDQRQSWHASFLPNTTLDSGEPRLLYSYRHVISGFAAKLTRKEVDAMKAKEGFLMALPNRRRKLGTTHAPEFLGLNQWESVWQKSNEGEGVIVGVMDGGILPTHVSFQDDGTMPEPPLKWRGCCQFSVTKCDKFVPSKCNNKLIGARAFGDSKSPDDISGHGSHVSGTAAGSRVYNASVLGQAKGTAVGMAPRAHLAMYKVCSTRGCEDKDTLKGVEQAIDDGVDVLSLSIDSRDDYQKSGVVKGTFRAMEKGIIASACAGNGGRSLNQLANDAPWILTVGASSMDRVVRATLKLGNGMELQGESAYQPSNFSATMMDMVYPGEIMKFDFYKTCLPDTLRLMNVTGKIVVCETWMSENVDKGKVVKAAGGAAMILLSQSWDGFTIKSDPHVIPTAHLSYADTLKVVSYFRTTKEPKATLIFQGTKTGARRAPAVASFSSRGPSLRNGGILKPDIIGPGVDILAAWNKQVGPDPSSSADTAFTFASGCSMATPLLAGIVALIKSSHPDWSPAMIKSAIVTTAHTVDRTGQPIADEKSNTLEKASFFAMGAGHVDPTKAYDPGLVYDNHPEEYIGYLCGLLKAEFYVRVVVGRRVDCSKVEKIEPEQLNYPSISVSLDSKTVTKINRTVTNVGVANSAYQVAVDAPEGLTVEVDPKELEFSEPKEKKSFSVTFTKKTSGPVISGEYKEGQLLWKSKGSNKYVVRSPIIVKF